MRLDTYLRERLGYRSRHHARQEIKAGSVLVNGETIRKPAYEVREKDRVETLSFRIPFVSFGGVKLSRALSAFALDVRGKVCLDVGASTGGFTDCALQRGAKKVYAVDVGTDQLAETLKADARVESFEETNFRDAKKTDFPDAEVVFVDVSFTSNLPILRHVHGLFGDIPIIALYKPRFETGKPSASGVAKDKAGIEKAFRAYLETLVHEGFSPANAVYAARQEKKGDREIFVHIDGSAPRREVAAIMKTLQETDGCPCSNT